MTFPKVLEYAMPQVIGWEKMLSNLGKDSSLLAIYNKSLKKLTVLRQWRHILVSQSLRQTLSGVHKSPLMFQANQAVLTRFLLCLKEDRTYAISKMFEAKFMKPLYAVRTVCFSGFCYIFQAEESLCLNCPTLSQGPNQSTHLEN